MGRGTELRFKENAMRKIIMLWMGLGLILTSSLVLAQENTDEEKERSPKKVASQDSKPLDVSKRILEMPLEQALGGIHPGREKDNVKNVLVIAEETHSEKPELDAAIFGSKSFIEAPTEWMLDLTQTIPQPPQNNESVNDGNPNVEPGLVNWHPDFETACAASKKSGKPVLLFHLLGKLDQRFT